MKWFLTSRWTIWLRVDEMPGWLFVAHQALFALLLVFLARDGHWVAATVIVVGVIPGLWLDVQARRRPPAGT